MLSLNIGSMEPPHGPPIAGNFAIRISRGEGLREYSTSARALDTSKNRIVFDETINIDFGSDKPDSLLVMSLLQIEDSHDASLLSTLYVSVKDLVKSKTHDLQFECSNFVFKLGVKAVGDERLSKTKFDSLIAEKGKSLGEDFGYKAFSNISLEFIKLITPVRKLYEKGLILLNWTEPTKTLMFLASVSFFILFIEWIFLTVGVLLWTPARKNILGAVFSIEVDQNTDVPMAEFKKNLAFLQLLQQSYVESVHSFKKMFTSASKNKLHSLVNSLRVLPLVGVFFYFFFDRHIRVGLITALWLVLLLIHPIGSSQLQASFTAIKRKIWPKETHETTKAGSTSPKPSPGNSKLVLSKAPSVTSSALIKDYVLYENQRWWLGPGFIAKFMMKGILM